MEKKWWMDKVVYEIYPKSFMDANNDGIGDLKGIIEKLDYLKDLGVDILWLTPFFVSPMEDNGYDVADYYNINPLFGTMADMDKLLEETKKRDMYIMMDIVANHTSKEHMWFKEAKKSKDNKYRNYYIWSDEKLFDHQSCFSGSAWEYDEVTKQYYFHEFAKGQPDLNWENPKILEEIVKIINFWMDKGIRGIRFDVIHLIGKEIENNIYAYGPTLHQKVRKLNELSFGRYDAITIGEAWGTLDTAIAFTKPQNKELNLVFQFEHMVSNLDYSKGGKFNPNPVNFKKFKDALINYQYGLNDISYNALVLENHDSCRSINKFGNLDYYLESAKEIAITNFMLKGIVFLYQGQELGMTNQKVNNLSDYNDVEIHGAYQEYVLEKKLLTHEKFMEGCFKECRDNARFPMQWDDSINAGFNKGAKPWLPVNQNYHTINAKNEINDPESIFNFYKKLLALRKEYSNTLIDGSFTNIETNCDDLFVFTRNGDYNICIVSNMSSSKITYKLPFAIKKVLLENYHNKKDCNITLQPYESFVYIY